MEIEAKIENPVCIRYGSSENVVLADEEGLPNQPLTPGVMFGGDRYGFVIILDKNGKQTEILYPTQCRIEGIGTQGDYLKIYEENKNCSWVFDKNGNLRQSAFDEFTHDFIDKVSAEAMKKATPAGVPILKNPLCVKIAKEPKKSVILGDDLERESWPLYPGAVIGDMHYGFILIIDTPSGQKEVCYPTQNKIDAIGIEGNEFGNLRVFEEGKYSPWLFTCDGKFVQEATYNLHSRRDQDYVQGAYGVNMAEAEEKLGIKVSR